MATAYVVTTMMLLLMILALEVQITQLTRDVADLTGKADMAPRE